MKNQRASVEFINLIFGDKLFTFRWAGWDIFEITSRVKKKTSGLILGR